MRTAEQRREQHIEDLKVMILSDTGHLNRYVAHGDRVLAHGMVDSIIDRTRELEGLTGERAPYVAPPADVDMRRAGPR